MFKKFLFFISCLLLTSSVSAQDITTNVNTSSFGSSYYIPQTTPQQMYGLSGQQFIPQINITGGYTGIKIDNPYYEKTTIKEESSNEQIKDDKNIPVNNPYEAKDFEPIYIK